MLIALWSPKGGSGTSVIAVTTALVLARETDGARLVDLDGDQPAVLGLADDPRTGVGDWLSAGPAAPTDALDRLAVDVAPGLRLIPRGADARVLAPTGRGRSRRGPGHGVAGRGGARGAGRRPSRHSGGASGGGVGGSRRRRARGRYLALRRISRHPLLERIAGAVMVEEVGRSIGARSSRPCWTGRSSRGCPRGADTRGRSTPASWVSPVPDALRRPATALLETLGLPPHRRGRAA